MKFLHYFDNPTLIWHSCIILTFLHYFDISVLFWHSYTILTILHYFDNHFFSDEFNEVTPDTEILEYCTNGNWVRAVFSALPAWFRFAQCLRRYKDTRDAFPHLVNAGKYSTTLFVVLFKFLNGVFATASFATVSKKI